MSVYTATTLAGTSTIAFIPSGMEMLLVQLELLISSASKKSSMNTRIILLKRLINR